MNTQLETETARAESEAELRVRIDALIDALHRKDLDALAPIYAEDVVSFDIEPPLRHVGRAAKLENWTRAFSAFRELDYELRDLTLVLGDVVAFGYGFGRLSGTLGDGTVTNGMWVRATFCFRRVEGAWQIAHDQVSVPLDIRTAKGLTDLEP
jgi:ketosteroid isomerase-like protein